LFTKHRSPILTTRGVYVLSVAEWAGTVQNLTVKNIVLAVLALTIFYGVINLRPPGETHALGTFSNVSQGQARDTQGKSTHETETRRPARSHRTHPEPKHPPVVKVLELPDSEALRLTENTFVDLGWRHSAKNGGEWVGHIGSDTEYVPLNAEQITGMLKEAQLKSLPPPPARHPAPPRSEPKEAPPPPEAINLLSYMPMLLGIFVMLYIRYRIIQATLDAAQSATGLVQRALSDLFSSRTKATKAQLAATGVIASRAPAPATTSGHIQTRTKRSSTVVRPAAGLFGMWSRAR